MLNATRHELDVPGMILGSSDMNIAVEQYDESELIAADCAGTFGTFGSYTGTAGTFGTFGCYSAPQPNTGGSA